MARLHGLAMAVVCAATLSACSGGTTAKTTPTPSAAPTPEASTSTPPPGAQAPSPAATQTATSAPQSGCLPQGTPQSQSLGVLGGAEVAGPTIAVVGAQQVWVPAPSGHILHSADGGATWVRQGTGAHAVHQVDMVDAEHGFAVAGDALLGTADGGACWTLRGDTPHPLREIHMLSAQSGWGVEGPGDPGGGGIGLGGTLVRTADGGATWTAVSGAPADAESVCFVDAQHGWLGAAATLMRTTDGGAHWTAVLYTAPRGQSTIQLECGAPATVSLLSLSLQGAAGNQPYAADWSQDGTHFTKVFDDMYSDADASPPPGSPPTAAPEARPGNPPGSYPGPFSIVDATTTFWAGTTPAMADRPDGVVVSHSGSPTTLARPPTPVNASAAGLAFTDATHGWLSTVAYRSDGTAVFDLYATSDGGGSWRTAVTE